MTKFIKVTVVILLSIIMILGVSCKNEVSQSDSICMEKYYERIMSEKGAQSYQQDFSYSYYYNLESDCEVRLELLLMHNGEEVEKIEIKDMKKDMGNIDGTFGLLVDLDEESNTINWTIRHDESTKQFTSIDFFTDTIGTHASLSNGGLMDNSGTTVFLSEYDLKEDGNRDGNKNSERNYEWKIELKIYGTKNVSEGN